MPIDELIIGEFETHITVAPTDEGKIDGLESWAAEHGYKFTHIELSRGTSASQPMVTSRGSGTLGERRGIADAAAAELEGIGFDVVRVKLEAAPSNDGVPATDAESKDVPGYFEHHVKLLLDEADSIEGLAEVVKPHGGHLSRNARRARPDGKHERFVTQRCYNVGRASAHAQLADLLAAIPEFEVIRLEEEYVIYDSDISVDAGWMAD